MYAALAAQGIETAWIDLTADQLWELRSTATAADATLSAKGGAHSTSWQEGFTALAGELAIDLAFPTMHGAIGEDGQIQTLCDSLSIPYVGCGPEAAIRCYDKVAFKRLVSSAGLPSADGLCVERQRFEAAPQSMVASVSCDVDFPCIVKPSRSGSSLGLARVDAPEALAGALEQAFRFDDVVLVEQFVVGSDVEIGICGNESLTIGRPVEIQSDAPLYDFASKYRPGGSSMKVPAVLPVGFTGQLMKAAHTMFVSAGCRGMARADFLVDRGSGRFVVNELNTIPYMTEASSFARSLSCATRQSYEGLIADLADLAWRR